MVYNPLVDRMRRLAEQQAAMPQRRGRLISYNPLAQMGALRDQQAQEGMTAGQRAVAAAIAARGGGKQEDDGGFLGSLLNNPVGKVVMGGLEALDVPRRMVISGIHEISDAIGSGDASWADFGNQTADKSFGVGDFVDTGNVWADRLLGFAGDVALDPMTYLTLGSGKAAGMTGRVAAAERLAGAGLDDAAARVGRLGASAANRAERDVIFAGVKNADKLAEPGVRFMGARIPGSGKVAEGVGTALGGARAKLGDTLPGGVVRRIRAPKGLEDAYKVLQTGKGNTVDALELIRGQSVHAASSGMFAAKHANEAGRLAHNILKDGDRNLGERIYQALDEGMSLDDLPLGRETQKFLEDVWTDAHPRVPEMGHRADYAPHQWTADARKALRGDEYADVRKAIGMDVTDATGGAVRRAIKDGTTLPLPDGSVVKFVADTPHGGVSARQVNEKLADALGVAKVVENDITQVLKPYVEGIAESVGRADRLASLTDRKALAVATEVDKKAMKEAGKAEAEQLGKHVATGNKEIDEIAGELRKGGTKVKKDVVAELERQIGLQKAERAAAKEAGERALKVPKALEGVRSKATAEASSAVSAAQKQLDELGVEQRLLHETATAERAAIDEGKLAGKRAHDASLKRAKRSGDPERIAKAAGPIPETEAARQARQALSGHVSKAQASIDARRDSILGTMSQAEAKAAKSYDEIDAARGAVADRVMFSKDRVADADAEIARLKGHLKKAKAINVTPASKAAYAKVEKELDDAVRYARLSNDPDTAALMSWYARGVAELRDGKMLNDGLVALQKAAARGEVTPIVKQIIRDGYEQIGTELLGDAAPHVRKELARQLKNMDVAVSDSGFWKVVDKYTQFFKTYATATVGFHVRNGMSAAFMNATDGVSVRNMGRGANLWEKFAGNPRGFYDNLPSWITPEQAEDAMRAVFASGGGAGQYGKAELRLGKNHLTNNHVTRFSQRIGGRVEGYARMGMAVDSILAGETWEAAAARITRIHFNYSEVSKFDKTMKRIIPFWTFTSRNVPLQIQQMFMKPRMYQGYKSLVRNMGQGEDDDMVPKSWLESGAFQLTDGVFVAPDLPHTRIISDLDKLTTDPQRLLADANPLFKVPFETLVAKRKLYNDQPFKENGFESVGGGGLQALAPLLSMLGLTETAGDGTQVIDEKLGYALRGLLPPAAQVQRLFGGDPYYDDKQGQSVANYFGLPLRMLTPGQRAAEEKRRKREADKAGANARQAALANWSNG